MLKLSTIWQLLFVIIQGYFPSLFTLHRGKLGLAILLSWCEWHGKCDYICTPSSPSPCQSATAQIAKHVSTFSLMSAHSLFLTWKFVLQYHVDPCKACQYCRHPNEQYVVQNECSWHNPSLTSHIALAGVTGLFSL